ncbi:hypothetical protein [Anaerocolumna sp. MB42-C2]|uniref:hypothetical protein n=1 Tax=Anaerocolumna sp. MB42-C2 TaxID=3070997 RepID=UPI0027E014DC|nr:hypothetical protein [Anaerocolumna sp. MB42-C2]WMJ88271.1 hypothetical protein RBU59_01825 [Anaerocolumna sp. MB42-C2]
MEMWNKDFSNISIQYEDSVVRIKADDMLMNFLELPSHGSYFLSQHILNTYETIFEKPLKISNHSLAIEIIAHVFVDTILENISDFSDSISHDKLKPVIDTLEHLREHTKIIDCGESSVDNNRFIWDSLVPFHTIIYGMAEMATTKDGNRIKS